jgi:hypothetical protein
VEFCFETGALKLHRLFDYTDGCARLVFSSVVNSEHVGGAHSVLPGTVPVKPGYW